MPLKHGFEKALSQLDKQGTADWLGFLVRRGKDGVTVAVGEKAWDHLQEKLATAHEKPDAPLRARTIIKGWVSQMGPCYRHTDLDAACSRIEAISHELAFDEIPGAGELKKLWQRAYARWCRLRADVEICTPAAVAEKG
jgi:hypothetical protein